MSKAAEETLVKGYGNALGFYTPKELQKELRKAVNRAQVVAIGIETLYVG